MWATLFLAVALLVVSVGADHFPDDSARYGSEYVVLRPGNVQTITTKGTSTTTVTAVQTLRIAPHQVLELTMNGIVTGGEFAVEFCTFDVELPGHVQYAPSLATADEIVVVTDNANVSQQYDNAGVYPQYPVRISTDDTTTTQDPNVYLIDMTLCSSIRFCEVTVPLQQSYVGPRMTNGNGRVWGCSWQATDTLPHDASALDVEQRIADLLGPGVVRGVTKLDDFSGTGSFQYNVTFEEGVYELYARIRDGNLRGNGLGRTTEQISPGYPLGTPFDVVAQNWGGYFQLAMAENPTDVTMPLAPTVLDSDFATALRELDLVGGDIQVIRSSDKYTWQVTFGDQIGFVPLLLSFTENLAPVGASVTATHHTLGEAQLSGQFELVNIVTDATVLISHSASKSQLAYDLNQIGFSNDISVSRTEQASPSNGFTWSVTYLGECPSPVVDMDVTVVDACERGVRVGSIDSLLGNNAEVVVERVAQLTLDASDIGLHADLLQGNIEWNFAATVPSFATDLPSAMVTPIPGTIKSVVELPDTGNGGFEFKVIDTGRAVGEKFIGKMTVYVDARRPHAHAGANLEVAKPTTWAILNATQSQVYYGADVASFSWHLLEAPSGSSGESGALSDSSNPITYATQLDVAGVFLYELQVVDTNGLVSRDQVSITVLHAPSVLDLVDQFAIPGQNASFSCVAYGSEPMTYTWIFNGIALDNNDNSPVLQISPVNEFDQGNYTCHVTNLVGEAYTNTAFLEVYDWPRMIEPLYSVKAYPGNDISLKARYDGTRPMQYFWEYTTAFTNLEWVGQFEDGDAGQPVLGNATWSLSDPNAVDWRPLDPPQANKILTFTDISEAGHERLYRCRTTNIVGTVYSNAFAINVVDPPSNVTIHVDPADAGTDVGIDPGPDSSFTLTCNSGGEVESYTWSMVSNPSFVATGKTYTATNITGAEHGGEYVCTVTNFAGVASSAPTNVNILSPPFIIVHPVSQHVDPEENVTFTVTAGGAEPLSYLWLKDGQYLDQQTYNSRSITFRSVDVSQSGDYEAVVYNHLGTVLSSVATLLVTVLPTIDHHPNVVGSVDPGESVELFCNATGTHPITYRWVQRLPDTTTLIDVSDGTEIVSETFARLLFPVVVPAMESDYACIATNSAGSVMSDFARLDVSDAPSILDGPNDTYVDPGQDAFFRVEVVGAEPISYQWRKDGVVIPLETGSELWLYNITLSDEAVYDCIATNRLNQAPGVLSRAARLRIARAPAITSQPADLQYVDPGQTAQLLVRFSGAPPLTFEWRFVPVVLGIDNMVDYEVVESGRVDMELQDVVLSLPNVTEASDGFFHFYVENRIGDDTSVVSTLRVNNPPIVTSPYVRKTIDPGAMVTFDCQVSADPEPTLVVWSHQREQGGTETILIRDGPQPMYTLEVANSTQNDEGVYWCATSNSAGSAKKAVGELSVRDPPVVVSLGPYTDAANQVLRVDLGQNIVLNVQAEGLLPMSFEWFLDGSSVSGLDAANVNLAIPDFGFEDEGRYTARAVNRLGSDVGDMAIIIELNKPAGVESLTIDPANGRVYPNGLAEIVCEVYGTPPFEFEWTFGLGAAITPEDFPEIVVFRETTNTSVLQISQASANVNGDFTCTVSNSARPGGDSASVSLEVLKAPVVRAATPLDANVFPNTDAAFECIIEEGSAPFSVQWFVGPPSAHIPITVPPSNDSSVKYEGYREEVVYSSSVSLTIKDALERDEDYFSCSVCNEMGCSQSRMAWLGVHNAPVITDQFPSPNEPEVAVNPGLHLELSVTATGLEPLGFEWRKQITTLGDPLDDLNSAPVVVDGANVYYSPIDCKVSGIPCKLVMNNVDSSVDGLYYARVTNPLGQVHTEPVTVSVNVPPNMVVTSDWPAVLKTACPGDAFVQTVEMVGTRPITYSWYYLQAFTSIDDLFGTSPFHVTEVGEFRLDNPEQKHEGFYGFRAENIAGVFQSTAAQLRVNPGPSAAADASGKSPTHAITLPQTSSTLSGDSSRDDFSTLVEYRWTLTESPEGSAAGVVFADPIGVTTTVSGLLVPGSYTFQLQVVNAMGCTDTDFVTVIVNSPPVAVADNVAVAVPTQQAILDGSRSHDPDEGDYITRMRWRLLSYNGLSIADGLNSAVVIATPGEPVTELHGLDIGSYVFTFEVEDTFEVVTVIEVQLSVFSIQFLTPSRHDTDSLLVGSCETHSISWQILGGLPDSSDVHVFAVEPAMEDAPTEDGGLDIVEIASGKLGNFSRTTMETGQVSAVYSQNWILGYDTRVPDAQVVHIEVVVATNEGKGFVKAVSDPFEIKLPYYYVYGEWSSCTNEANSDPCERTGVMTRTAVCMGHTKSQMCGLSSVQFDMDKCWTYLGPPAVVQSCNIANVPSTCGTPAYVWEAGVWDDSACHVDHPCFGDRERPVTCVAVDGSVLDDDACSGLNKPSPSLPCDMLFPDVDCSSQTFTWDEAFSNTYNPSTCTVALSAGQFGSSYCTNEFGIPLLQSPSPCGNLPPGPPGNGGDELPASCNGHAWVTGTWVCDHVFGKAVRDVTCAQVDAPTVPVASSLCEANSPMPGTETRCATSTHPAVATEYATYWKATGWEACSEKCIQHRQVVCVTSDEVVVDRSHCEHITPPRAKRICGDCSSTGDWGIPFHAGCGSGGSIQCFQGTCNEASRTCECHSGWGGMGCETTESCASTGGILDIHSDCCATGVLDRAGECCDGTSPVLDKDGVCCATGALDACGVCNGGGRLLDLVGQCCDTVLDASGSCCHSGNVDRCGVCDGTGLTCYLEVQADALLTEAELSSVGEFVLALQAFKTKVLERTNATDDRLVEIFHMDGLSSNVNSRRRRRLATTNTTSSHKVGFGVLPQSMADLNRLEQFFRSSDNQVVDPSSFPTFSARGVCGNGLCEVKERCGFFRSEGCCAADCPLVEIPSKCPSDCSGHGSCLVRSGECSCHVGYTGADCSVCDAGYGMLSNGHCVRQAANALASAPITPVTEQPTQAPTVNNTVVVVVREPVEEQVVPLWAILLGTVSLALLLLLLFVFCYRERESRKRDSVLYLDTNSTFPNGKAVEMSSGNDVCTVLLQSWLWKRSTSGLEGHHVWHQWFMALTEKEETGGPGQATGAPSNKYVIEYYNSEKVFLENNKAIAIDVSPTNGKSKQIRSRRNSALEHVQEQNKEIDGEGGFISLRGLRRVVEGTQNEKGYFPFTLVFQNGETQGTTKTKLLAHTQVEQRNWVTELSSIAQEPFVPARVGEGHGRNQAFSAKSVGSSSLLSSETGGLDGGVVMEEAPVAAVMERTPPDAVIGSLSGAIGERVVVDGWFHVKFVGRQGDESQDKKWTKVCAVIFLDLGEMRLFEKMEHLNDGSTAYFEELYGLPMEAISCVKDLGRQGNERLDACFEVDYWVGNQLEDVYSMYLMAKTREEALLWMNSMEDYFLHRLGRNVISTAHTAAIEPLITSTQVVAQDETERGILSQVPNLIVPMGEDEVEVEIVSEEGEYPSDIQSRASTEANSELVYDDFQKMLTGQSAALASGVTGRSKARKAVSARKKHRDSRRRSVKPRDDEEKGSTDGGDSVPLSDATNLTDNMV